MCIELDKTKNTIFGDSRDIGGYREALTLRATPGLYGQVKPLVVRHPAIAKLKVRHRIRSGELQQLGQRQLPIYRERFPGDMERLMSYAGECGEEGLEFVEERGLTLHVVN